MRWVPQFAALTDLPSHGINSLVLYELVFCKILATLSLKVMKINHNSLKLNCSKPAWISLFCWIQNHLKNMGNRTGGLRRKRTGLLLSGSKSSFQMKVNLAFNLEIKVPESGGREERHRIHVAWSPVWSFHSQWWFGLPCHLLVLVHCVFWSPQSTVIYQDILEHFMLPSADKLYGDADFIFQQDLAPAHTAKGTKSWFNDHGVTVLDWPANSPDLNPIVNLWWETPDPTMQMTWRMLSKQPGLHYTWAVTQTDHLHATPHWCSNSWERSPNQVLSA